MCILLDFIWYDGLQFGLSHLSIALPYPLTLRPLHTQNWVRRIFFIMVNKTRALRYLKNWVLEREENRGKKLTYSDFEYVNRHFSVGNNTRGSTYSNKDFNKDGQHDDDDKREKWLIRI